LAGLLAGGLSSTAAHQRIGDLMPLTAAETERFLRFHRYCGAASRAVLALRRIDRLQRNTPQ
jgi:hypothetical protein